jgi:hypothetical protein
MGFSPTDGVSFYRSSCKSHVTNQDVALMTQYQALYFEAGAREIQVDPSGNGADLDVRAECSLA